MTAYLPPNLLALFAARDPITFWPPIERPSHHRQLEYTGIAQYVNFFEDPSETPAPVKVETREEKRERKRREKAEQIAYKVEQDLALWNPMENANATKDPYKTLFVARINFDTTESKLKREFEVYGPIKTIKIVKDTTTGKPRGYCFIEYEHERDMHAAYKHADGKKIDDYRVLVDVERARTVKNWRPRRLGGGLGNSRKGPEHSSKVSGREDKEKVEKKRHSRSRERDRKERRRDRSPRSDRKKKRSRSKEKKKHRSRSRDKKKRDRSRGKSRDRSKDRKKRRERDENGMVSAVQKYGEYGADME